jgi:hypothetical protein
MRLFEADRATCPHHLAQLCGSHTLATPILLANAAIFAYLAFRQGLLLVFYTTLYALALFWLNRSYLLRPGEDSPHRS